MAMGLRHGRIKGRRRNFDDIAYNVQSCFILGLFGEKHDSFLFVLEKENSDHGNDLHVVSISFLIFTKHVSLPFFLFLFFFPLMYI